MIGRRKSLLKKERPATPIIRVHADALNPLAADRDHGPYGQGSHRLHFLRHSTRL
jgi:hypothetical protein